MQHSSCIRPQHLAAEAGPDAGRPLLQVMRWMEQCSFIAASRVGRGHFLLTGAMDDIAFAQPTRVGDILYITAQVCSAPAAAFTGACAVATSLHGSCGRPL